MQPFTSSMVSLQTIFFFFILSCNFTINFATSRLLLGTTETDFVNASCQATRYPDLCFRTLSPYAATIQSSSLELANTALNASLKSAKSTSKVVRQLLKGRDMNMRGGEAVADCLENMSDSIDEIKKSMVALKDLDGPEFAEKMEDVKTWVSAALTDEDTCMDGFEEIGEMKETIRGYIVNVAELTSIALALISNIH